MKIRKISCDEIMVFLSNDDLEFFEIEPDDIKPQSNELHKFLFVLMETVQDETGFDPYHGQVVVEAVPTKSGLHITISKTGENKGRISRSDFKRARGVRATANRSQYYKILNKNENESSRIKSDKKACAVFVFESFTDMENAVALMSDTELAKGELYRNDKRYALILKCRAAERCVNMLSEFAVQSSRSRLLANDIREGWRHVAAGERLIVMASAIRSMR